jgi:uncharacterized protein YciI
VFVVLLSYLRPLAEVDALLEAHRAYLAKQYANGVFLLSGLKEPRTGGVIIARAKSLEELHGVLAEDPFQVHGVAAYEVVEFVARAVAPGLERLVGAHG